MVWIQDNRNRLSVAGCCSETQYFERHSAALFELFVFACDVAGRYSSRVCDKTSSAKYAEARWFWRRRCLVMCPKSHVLNLRLRTLNPARHNLTVRILHPADLLLQTSYSSMNLRLLFNHTSLHDKSFRFVMRFAVAGGLISKARSCCPDGWNR